MIAKKISLIPIYSMSKEKFNNKWKKKKESVDFVSELYDPIENWKYNQIIGFVEVLISKQDIIFEVYKYRLQRYIFTSKRKKFMDNIHVNGTHFRIVGMNNNEIRVNFMHYLDLFKDSFTSDNEYLDLEIINNTLESIDFKKIITSLNTSV